MYKNGIRLLAGMAVVVLAAFALAASAGFAQAAPGQQPTFGSAVISGDVTSFGREPLEVLPVYPERVKGLVGLLEIQFLPADTKIQAQWYRDGQAATLAQTLDVKQSDTSAVITFVEPNGLDAGSYEVRFSYNGKVVGTASTRVAAITVYYPFEFGSDYTRISFRIVNPMTEFPRRAKYVATIFRFSGVPRGASAEAKWLKDGKDYNSIKFQFSSTSGTQALALRNTDGLPDGSYDLRLYVNGKEVQSGQFNIGR